MKKIFLLLFSFILILNASDFVSPINFKGTEIEKKAVIEYIKDNMNKSLEKIGMNDPSTLRLMEKKELSSFKELIKTENTKLLKSVIESLCSINMCEYSTINLMYKKQLKDSAKELEW